MANLGGFRRGGPPADDENGGYYGNDDLGAATGWYEPQDHYEPDGRAVPGTLGGRGRRHAASGRGDSDDGYGRYLGGSSSAPQDRPRTDSDMLKLGRPPLRERRGGKVVIALGVVAALAVVALVGNAWLSGGGETPPVPLPTNPGVSVSLSPSATALLDPPVPAIEGPANTKTFSSNEVGFGLAYPANWVAIDLAAADPQANSDFLKSAGGTPDLTGKLLVATIQNGGVFLATDPATGNAPGRAAVMLSIVSGGPAVGSESPDPDGAAPPSTSPTTATPSTSPPKGTTTTKPPGAATELAVADVRASLERQFIVVDTVVSDRVGPFKVIRSSGTCPAPVPAGAAMPQCSSLDFTAEGRHWRLTMIGLPNPDLRAQFMDPILSTLKVVFRPN